MIMNLQAQAQLHDKRGEHDLAAHLREIVAEEFMRLKKIAIAKRKADKLVFTDEDF